MATLEQLSAALVKADAAGNTEDAQAFANAIRQMQVAPAAAPAPVQSEIPAPRQSPGFMTQLGRGAASLADVTVGGVLPAVAQQVGYPLARLGRTPEEAQAATRRMVGAVEQPFGKAFGVTETPEYQQESGRQVLDFIGQNFQKGAKWIAEKTGLPQSDIENYLGTATVAAPKVVPPVARAIRDVAAPAIEKTVIGAKMPFEARAQAKRERQSLEDYARGPQLDAIAEAQRMKIALPPEYIQPTIGPKLTSMAAGPRGPAALAETNKNQVRIVALEDMGLPATAQLNSVKTFQEARAQVAQPYEQVKKLPVQQADDAMIQRLEEIRADLDVIGAKEYAPAIGKIVDDAISKTQTGLTGEQLLKNISVLRERARKTYNNKSATTEALDIADTNLKVATELESMMDNSIFNPKLLQQYRDARQKMARTYAYEGATDLNTGMVDVSKLARITSKDSALTGDIASLGKIAGNFPEAFTTKPTPGLLTAPRLSRSGAGGAAGALIGSQFGLTGSILGGALGGLGTEVLGAAAARRMASPGYQSSLQMRDMRIPVNQLAASMQPIPQDRALVPYQAPVEVLMPGEGPYQPNFVMQPGQYGARVTPGVADIRNALPAPSAEGTMNMLRAEQQRAAGMSRTLGQQAETQQAAAEAAARQTTRGGQIFDLDPVTGRLVPVDTPLRGATPDIQIIESTGKNLASAVAKMSGQMLPETTGTVYRTQTISPKSGTKPYTRITKREGETTFGRESQAFNMTAEEKIAWNKAKADLAEVMPGMKAMTDEAIASRMADVKWAEQAVANARAKAEGLARQEALLTEQLANRNNLRLLARDIEAKNKQLAKIQSDRQSMMALAEQMEEGLRANRPVKTGGQGPKTRAFQRNMLRPDDGEIQNALVK
jgi:hypothetical protein